MSAQYDADASVAASPPKRLRKRYRRDVRAVTDLDGRTTAARCARDLAARLRVDSNCDATAARGELITRCTLLSVLAGDCEVKVLRGQPIDVHAYVALVNCQRRILQVLGIVRDPKIIDGQVDGHATAARLANVWPAYREAEADRLAAFEAKIAALEGDDSEQLTSDAETSAQKDHDRE